MRGRETAGNSGVVRPADSAPIERIVPLLRDRERIVAIRPAVALDRRVAPVGAHDLAGDLVITSERLIHAGRRIVTVDLDDIDQAVLSGQYVLLALRDGRGVTLDVAQPAGLRSEIGAVRAARAASRRA